MINDVSRAYSYAPNLEPIFVELCEEDREEGDEDMCGELLVSMYGTRPAESNWRKCYTELLIANGFTRTRASTCVFHHASRHIKMMVHGDDFVSTGDDDDLQWLQTIFECKFEIYNVILGHEEKDTKTAKVLNWIKIVCENAYSYGADARHPELIIKSLKLQEAKQVSTPYVEETYEEDSPLEHDKFKAYQSIRAGANFRATDRNDIILATKEACRAMSKLTSRGWARLKRIGRYLLKRKHLVYYHNFQDDINTLQVYYDVSWASNKQDRKSKSGGIVMFGDHFIKAWSKTRAIVALSSAESELYAIVKASAEILGLKPIYTDIGMNIKSIMYSDASSALGKIQRQGLGTTRNIDCGYLFVQNLNAEKMIRYRKISGTANPADMHTRGLNEENTNRYFTMAKARFVEGRPELYARIQC